MNYLHDIYILDHIKRYSTVYTIRQESVASHSFFVAAILFKLHDDYKFDLGRAIKMAIVHDMPEIELNDVPRLIKAKYPRIEKAFKQAEKAVIKLFPRSVREALADYEITSNSIEARMVKFADAIQCQQFSHTEVKMGNTGYMAEVQDASTLRIMKFKLQLEEFER